jgi:ABC-type transporter Mla MlaB component
VNDQQSEAARVILDGPLTVRWIDTVQAKLVAALLRHTIVTVDCTGATEVDLSLIQLLIAARTSARHAGKTLRMAAPAEGVLHAALIIGGFLPDAPDAVFWTGSDAAS